MGKLSNFIARDVKGEKVGPDCMYENHMIVTTNVPVAKKEERTKRVKKRAEEKRLKGTMADRKKRAERRKKHYEEAQADPNQFLQVLPAPGSWCADSVHTACTMY